MEQAIPYPVDYQLSLERTLRIRLDALRVAGRSGERRIVEETLARLRTAEFGACLACDGVIPFLEMAADPTRQTCLACLEREGGQRLSTS